MSDQPLMIDEDVFMALSRDKETLAAEVARLKKVVDGWEEREAACCPEDTGFDEVIAALTRRISRLLSLLPYERIVTVDDEGDFVVRIHELPGCIAHGRTEAEAFMRLDEMEAMYLEDMLASGAPVPMPAVAKAAADRLAQWDALAPRIEGSLRRYVARIDPIRIPADMTDGDIVLSDVQAQMRRGGA